MTILATIYKRLLDMRINVGKIGVRQRVKNVLNDRKPAFWLTLVAIVAFLAVAIGFLTDPRSAKSVVVDERLDKAVSAAILDYNNRKFAPGVISGEGHRILLATEGNGAAAAPARRDTRIVYALCGYATYQFPNGSPVMASGSYPIPTVMTFTIDANGSYILKDYQEARDGTEMGPSIRRMFPKSIQKAVLNPSEADRKELIRQMESYAAVYLQQVGRPDTDVNPDTGGNTNGGKIIALASVLSPTVAKDLLKQYQAYPDFLNSQSMTGSWETDEKDGRYVYEVLWESSGDQRGKLIFRKSTWDGGKVVSSIEYQIDGDRYQLVERITMPLAVFSTIEIDQAKAVVRAYYTALAARNREALRQTLAEPDNRMLGLPDDAALSDSGRTDLLDVHFNPDDPIRIAADGNPLEFKGDPANIIVLRADLRFMGPPIKGATAAPQTLKDCGIGLIREGLGAPWKIDHMGY